MSSRDKAEEPVNPSSGWDHRLFQGNAEELDQLLPPEKKYDLVYSFGVIHHTPHPERVMASAARRLKREGEFRLMLYSRYCWKVSFKSWSNSSTGTPRRQPIPTARVLGRYQTRNFVERTGE